MSIRVVSSDPKFDELDVDVPVTLKVVFNGKVKKGTGFVHIIDENSKQQDINVRSQDVKTKNRTAIINMKSELFTEYTVTFDSESFLDLDGEPAEDLNQIIYKFRTIRDDD